MNDEEHANEMFMVLGHTNWGHVKQLCWCDDLSIKAKGMY